MSFFGNCLKKNVLMTTKTKVSHDFALDKKMDWGRCILYQKDSSAPLLDLSRNRNNTVCGYVNLKTNIEEIQKSEVLFPLGNLARLNELQEGDEIIQNLMKGKAKWHKTLRISTFSLKVSQIIINFESCLT